MFPSFLDRYNSVKIGNFLRKFIKKNVVKEFKIVCIALKKIIIILIIEIILILFMVQKLHQTLTIKFLRYISQ